MLNYQRVGLLPGTVLAADHLWENGVAGVSRAFGAPASTFLWCSEPGTANRWGCEKGLFSTKNGTRNSSKFYPMDSHGWVLIMSPFSRSWPQRLGYSPGANTEALVNEDAGRSKLSGTSRRDVTFGMMFLYMWRFPRGYHQIIHFRSF